jgi:hypothetical protein
MLVFIYGCNLEFMAIPIGFDELDFCGILSINHKLTSISFFPHNIQNLMTYSSIY